MEELDVDGDEAVDKLTELPEMFSSTPFKLPKQITPNSSGGKTNNNNNNSFLKTSLKKSVDLDFSLQSSFEVPESPRPVPKAGMPAFLIFSQKKRMHMF